jgi:hypothetical protein
MNLTRFSFSPALFLLIAAMFAACNSPKEQSSSPASSENVEQAETQKPEEIEDPAVFPPTEEAVFHLRRTPCFGVCEVYSLSIWADGQVRYEGAQNVGKIGTFRASLSPMKVEELIARANEIGFWEMRSEYPSGDFRIADLPTATTTMRVGDQTHQVLNRGYANPEVPEEQKTIDDLMLLESLADDLTANLHYLMVGDHPNPPPGADHGDHDGHDHDSHEGHDH